MSPIRSRQTRMIVGSAVLFVVGCLSDGWNVIGAFLTDATACQSNPLWPLRWPRWGGVFLSACISSLILQSCNCGHRLSISENLHRFRVSRLVRSEIQMRIVTYGLLLLPVGLLGWIGWQTAGLARGLPEYAGSCTPTWVITTGMATLGWFIYSKLRPGGLEPPVRSPGLITWVHWAVTRSVLPAIVMTVDGVLSSLIFMNLTYFPQNLAFVRRHRRWVFPLILVASVILVLTGSMAYWWSWARPNILESAIAKAQLNGFLIYGGLAVIQCALPVDVPIPIASKRIRIARIASHAPIAVAGGLLANDPRVASLFAAMALTGWYSANDAGSGLVVALLILPRLATILMAVSALHWSLLVGMLATEALILLSASQPNLFARSRWTALSSNR